MPNKERDTRKFTGKWSDWLKYASIEAFSDKKARVFGSFFTFRPSMGTEKDKKRTINRRNIKRLRRGEGHELMERFHDSPENEQPFLVKALLKARKHSLQFLKNNEYLLNKRGISKAAQIRWLNEQQGVNMNINVFQTDHGREIKHMIPFYLLAEYHGRSVYEMMLVDLERADQKAY